MASKIRRLVTVGCTATLALSTLAAPLVLAAPSATAATTPTAVPRQAGAAALWLAKQLLGPDEKVSATRGNHLDYPPSPYGMSYWGGLTASAVFGFAAAKTGATQISRILPYMRQHVRSDANIGKGKPGAYDGSVATYALVAEVTRTSATNFGGVNLLKQLKSDQCTRVSKPKNANDYTTPVCPAAGAGLNIYSSVSESLIITAEARAGGKYAPSAAAVKYFLSLQCPNGGFNGDDTSKCTSSKNSSVDETAYALMALKALGGHVAQRNRAIEYLQLTRNKSGYWSAQGAPDVDTTGLAIAALDGIWTTPAQRKILAASRAWLYTQQVKTGGQKGAMLYPYRGKFTNSASQKATADALLGLAPGGSLATLKVRG